MNSYIPAVPFSTVAVVRNYGGGTISFNFFSDYNIAGI